MQIVPTPGASWSHAAAAQQASSDPRAGAVARGAPQQQSQPAISDVERTSETMDRDANGQYDGGSGQRSNARAADEDSMNATDQGTAILDLPAIGQSNELDLLG
jgi:hypothetical protein